MFYINRRLLTRLVINGIISTLCATCPDGWTKGMLVKQERERDEKGRFKKRD